MIAEVLAWDYSQRWWLGTLGTQRENLKFLKPGIRFLMGIVKPKKNTRSKARDLWWRISDTAEKFGRVKVFLRTFKTQLRDTTLFTYLTRMLLNRLADRNLSNSTQFIGELKATELLNKYVVLNDLWWEKLRP